MTRTTAKPRLIRLCGATAVALVVGIAVAAMGARMVSGISQFGADTRTPQADVAQLPQDDLLRQLAAELSSGNQGEAAGFNDIAPAAGAPLGQ